MTLALIVLPMLEGWTPLKYCTYEKGEMEKNNSTIINLKLKVTIKKKEEEK